MANSAPNKSLATNGRRPKRNPSICTSGCDDVKVEYGPVHARRLVRNAAHSPVSAGESSLCTSIFAVCLESSENWLKCMLDFLCAPHNVRNEFSRSAQHARVGYRSRFASPFGRRHLGADDDEHRGRAALRLSRWQMDAV